MRPSFFLHLHPPTIPTDQAKWSYTLGAGGIAFFFVIMLLFSGMLLSFYYVPYHEEAALSVQRITFLVPFGRLIRNLHYWSAQGLVIISFIHLLRVVLTGAYLPPRRFNYVLGLIVFLFILFENFSGYILRWDEGIHWALVIATNLIQTIPIIGQPIYHLIIGGDQVNPDTLTRFYALHVIGLFLPLAWLTGWHLFRVRRDGGIAVPKRQHDQNVIIHYETSASRIKRSVLAQREGLAALISLAGLLIWSTIFAAPLSTPMDLNKLEHTAAHAPWFFIWVQYLLSYGDPLVWGVILPILLFTVLLIIPFGLPLPNPTEIGRWFPRSGRVAQGVFLLWTAAIIILTLLAFLKWGFAL